MKGIALFDHVPALLTEAVARIIGDRLIGQLVAKFREYIVEEHEAHAVDLLFIDYAQMGGDHRNGAIQRHPFLAVSRFFCFCSFSSMRLTRRKI